MLIKIDFTKEELDEILIKAASELVNARSFQPETKVIEIFWDEDAPSIVFTDGGVYES